MARSIQQLWDAARRDAGYSATEARCYLFPGAPSRMQHCNWAMYFQPGDPIHREVCAPMSQNQAADSQQYLNAHRVIAFAGASTYEVAGLLRHELEHARQRVVYGSDLRDLHHASVETLMKQFGNDAGVGVVYNLLPMERDANAAAAVFIRAEASPIPPAVLDGEHGVLFRSATEPAPLPSLGPRMLAFASIFGGTFETVLQDRNQDVSMLDQLVDNADEIWNVLVTNQRLAELALDAVAATPDSSAITAARPKPGDAWTAARAALTRAYEHAFGMVGSMLLARTLPA